MSLDEDTIFWPRDEDGFLGHGEIKFYGMDEANHSIAFCFTLHHYQYVTVKKVPNGPQLLHLFSSIWHLQPPTLVISVHGSYTSLKKRFNATFKKGLWRTMESAGCWIIGDGLERGIGKVAGEAVTEYTEAYGGDRMMAIGVVPMSRLKYRHMFNANANVFYPDEADETETDPAMTIVQRLTNQKFDLDKNFTTLVLVNEETASYSHPQLKLTNYPGKRLIETRVAVERAIVSWRTAENEQLQSKPVGDPAAIPSVTPGVTSPQPEFRASIQPPSPSMIPTIGVNLATNINKMRGESLGVPLESPDALTTKTSTSMGFSFSRRLSSLRSSALNAFHTNSTSTPATTPGSHRMSLGFEIEQSGLLQIPICGILAGGDRMTLHQVFASVHINHCPMVVVRGSGGAANVLASVVDLQTFMANLGEEMNEEEVNYKIASILRETDEFDNGAFYMRETKPVVEIQQKSPPFKGSPLKSRRESHVSFKLTPNSTPIRNQTQAQSSKVAPINIDDFFTEVILLRKLTEEYSNLISIFDSDDTDLDGYVITALLSSASRDIAQGVLNTEQLEIAVRLNRADIAKEKIFIEGRLWKRHDLDKFMFDAILNDQEAFVCLFIENGFDLETFLTVHMLEKLYTAGFYKHVMLRDIGRVVKQLLGDFYQPFYLSKRFRKTIKRAITRHEAEEKEIPITENPWLNKKNSVFRPLNKHSTSGSSQSNSNDMKSPPGNGNKGQYNSPALSSTLSSNHSRKKKEKIDSVISVVNNQNCLINGKGVANGTGLRRAIVVPLSREAGHSSNVLTNGKGGMNGRSRGALRRVVNGAPTKNDGSSIWSTAPVAVQENFDYNTKTKKKKKDSNQLGHVNVAFQRFALEQSSIQEMTDSFDMENCKKTLSSTSSIVSHVIVTKSRRRLTQNLVFQVPNDDFFPSSLSSEHVGGIRKTSFAGKHRGHHRAEISKLTPFERERILSAEAKRREAHRQEEKERKRRHRLAQGKRSFYERIVGINSNQKMEQCVPETLAGFCAMQQVCLERPARELMLMCVLLGKLKMAQLFWGYEKEPIGGAMFCTLILGRMSAITTDLSQKQEYERYARVFEEKAEEVLEECYSEDASRAKMLLYRQLEDYGYSAVIRLAARGGCIHFMSHPCCQDFLSEVWMGKLSPKTTTFQLLTGAFMGIVCPFLLPQVVYYARMDKRQTPLGINDEETSDDTSSYLNSSDFGEQEHKKKELNIMKTPKRWLLRQVRDIVQFYQAPITRFLYNTLFYATFLLIFSNMVLHSLTISYSTQEIIICLMVFSLFLEEIKQAFGPGASVQEYLSDGWNKLDCMAITFYFIGFILRYLSFVKIRDVDMADAMVVLGLVTENISCIVGNKSNPSKLVEYRRLPRWAFNSETAMRTALEGGGQPVSASVLIAWKGVSELSIDHPYFILTEEWFNLARIFFAFSLFAFFVRLMYIFSFSIVLGPKLIMITRMVVNDLLPFLILLTVIQVGYGVSVFAISYPNGYYTTFMRGNLTANSTLKRMTAGKIVYEFLMTAYFQMLGDFGLDILEGEDGGCRDDNTCPQFSSRKLSVIALSFFILLTQLLMLNLLVATFTSTYFEIEGSSIYFWSYQRYEMIQEFVDRPSVAPPFILIWYTVEFLIGIAKRLKGLCPGFEDFEAEESDDPFCRTFSANFSLESKLMKWEFMKAQGVLRAQLDSELFAGRRKGAEGARSTMVLRGGVRGAGGAASGSAPGGRTSAASGFDADSELDGMANIFGPDTEFIEEKFHALSNQCGKIIGYEDRLDKICAILKRLTHTVSNISHNQLQIIKSLDINNGRRLVGKSNAHPKTQEITNILIKDVIREAVKGLSKHCIDIEEKIEEKLRIEGLCVQAVMTNTDTTCIGKDAITPAIRQPPSRRPEAFPPNGTVLERLLSSHRLWRFLPFNFERRPGMRVNIPDRLVDWKVIYPDYRPFVVTGERIAFPYPEVEDGPNLDPATIHYSTYDNVQGVSRCSLQGRVRVGRANDAHLRGLPLNPRGRSGLAGKGLLPHWGPNHMIVLALTRRIANSDEVSNRLQVLMLERNQCFCLPWYLVDHRENCDLRSCSARILREFLLRRVNHVFKEDNPRSDDIRESSISSISTMNISMISDDFLDDQLNADHAWIEAIVINFHTQEGNIFPDEMTQLFPEEASIENAKWVDFSRPIHLRPSQQSILLNLLQRHKLA